MTILQRKWLSDEVVSVVLSIEHTYLIIVNSIQIDMQGDLPDYRPPCRLPTMIPLRQTAPHISRSFGFSILKHLSVFFAISEKRYIFAT